MELHVCAPRQRFTTRFDARVAASLAGWNSDVDFNESTWQSAIAVAVSGDRFNATAVALGPLWPDTVEPVQATDVLPGHLIYSDSDVLVRREA